MKGKSSNPLLGMVRGIVNQLQGSVRNRRKRGSTGPRTNRSMTRAMPAAYAAHVRPRFNVSSRTATSAVVTGCDLVYPIPANLAANTDTIFAMFPANPAYWMGTRISQFAPAYQNYRPIQFRVSYIPQVAVTQQGTVFMGTLWNEAAPVDNIQQSLFTSNGGCLTQCYVPADTTVALGRNLQQNLFTMNDALNPDTCPFMFLAGVRGATVVPGYFYVTYTYEFRNPIGSAWAFNTSQPVTVAQLPTLPTYQNMTFVLTQQASTYGPGTQLDLESDGNLYYHHTLVDLPTTATGVLYGNQQTAITTNTLQNYFTLTGVSSGGSSIAFADFNDPSGSVTVPVGSLFAYYESNAGTITVTFFKNETASSVTATPLGPYTIITTATSTLDVLTAAGTVYASARDSVTNDTSSIYIRAYPPYVLRD